MNIGKETCKALKEIRTKIARENNIEFKTSQCNFEGNCTGTCPKCEAELKYIEDQLKLRSTNGFVTKVAGLSIGLASIAPVFLSSCSPRWRTTGKVVPPKEESVDSSKTTEAEGLKMIEINTEPLCGLIVPEPIVGEAVEFKPEKEKVPEK